MKNLLNVSLLALALASLGACSSNNSTNSDPVPLASIGESCTSTDECEEGLECISLTCADPADEPAPQPSHQGTLDVTPPQLKLCGFEQPGEFPSALVPLDSTIYVSFNEEISPFATLSVKVMSGATEIAVNSTVKGTIIKISSADGSSLYNKGQNSIAVIENVSDMKGNVANPISFAFTDKTCPIPLSFH